MKMVNGSSMKVVQSIRRAAALGALIGTLAMTGCAHGIASWIVSTRDQQGARSLEAAHYKDAAHAFELALKIDPEDQRARDGYVEAQADLAETFYQQSQFQDALTALAAAQKIDPQNVRVAGLTADVNNARLKSSIVHSNYPSYKETTEVLIKSYTELRTNETEITYRLKRFGYTYDTADLTRAIRSSLDLENEVTKLTSRLNQLRSLVSAGTITPESGSAPATGPSSSLLPIP